MFYKLSPAMGRWFILAAKSSLAQEMMGTLDSEMVPDRTSCPTSGYPSTAVLGADGRAACGWGKCWEWGQTLALSHHRPEERPRAGDSGGVRPPDSVRAAPTASALPTATGLGQSEVTTALPQEGLQKPGRFLGKGISEVNDTRRKSSSRAVPH